MIATPLKPLPGYETRGEVPLSHLLKVISCHVREALYVLDGLLSNITELEPAVHSTDTAGFTEHLFGLCFLLGFSFQPRLADLPHQQLYKLATEDRYGKLDVLFSGVVNVDLIREQWDQLVRVAASLKNGSARPAPIFRQPGSVSDQRSG